MPGLRRRVLKRKRPCDCDSPAFNGDADDPEVSFNNNNNFNVLARKRLKLSLPEREPEPEPPPPQETPLRKSPNGYILPDPLPSGIVVKDLRGLRWKVGKSVGIGGFGEIYSACSARAAGDYVLKVEPHTNGPLFVEVNYYLRSAKKEWIDSYKEEHELDHLGVPYVKGSGSFWFQGKKLRFLVIPRYGTDLQTLLDSSGSSLSIDTACHIASQMVDSYEYIHSKGYIHKDLKGSNLLFEDYKKDTTTTTSGMRIYLVDFGLASRYTHEGVHKPYVGDARSAHEGTLEYNSRDSHMGCVSRRGDIEVLFYNLIDWIGGRLPWDQPNLVSPKAIQELKVKAFRDCSGFLGEAFEGESHLPEDFLLDMMEYIGGMEFEEEPDYDYLRRLLDRGRPRSPSEIALSDSVGSADEVVLSFEMKSKAAATKQQQRSKARQRGKKCRKRSPRGNADGPRRPDEKSLSVRSAERFRREWESVVTANGRKSLQNPTPVMIDQLSRMGKRETSNGGANHKGQKKRSSPKQANGKRRQTESPKPARRSRNVKTQQPNLRKDPLRTPPEGNIPPRRSLRIPAAANAVERTSSITRNISEFFATVTKSIFRMKQN